jgi:hypothetical protein
MSWLRVLSGRNPGGDSSAMTAPASGLARDRAALAIVWHEPSLWAFGALSFAVRGGWLLLAVPIITFPGDGQLSTIFGPVLTTSGPSSGLAVLLAIAGVAALLVAGVAILLAAYADVSAFDRTVHRRETAGLRSGRVARELVGGERRGLLARVAGVQALGLLAILAVAGVVGRQVPQIVVAELQFPSNATDPVVTRVLGQIRGDLLVLVAMVVLVDIAVAIVSRRLMARGFGLADGAHPGSRSAARGLPRIVLTAVTCWIVTVAVLVPVLWVSGLGWAAVRDLFLAPGMPSGPDLVRELLTLVAFVATWVAGFALAGLASAVRASLWTMGSLR